MKCSLHYIKSEIIWKHQVSKILALENIRRDNSASDNIKPSQTIFGISKMSQVETANKIYYFSSSGKKETLERNIYIYLECLLRTKSVKNQTKGYTGQQELVLFSILSPRWIRWGKRIYKSHHVKIEFQKNFEKR